MTLDRTDRAILEIMQNEMPLSIQPFADLAEQLQISQTEVIERITVMKESGLIRRVGGIFNAQKLGYFSTLCALSAPDDRIDEVAALINRLESVTHNYLRDHHYNIWFTITAPSRAEAEQQLRELEEACGLQIMSMPAQKLYKIKVSFDMEDRNSVK